MDYKELLKKAQEEQAEKIAAEQERLRKQKEEEERKAAEEKARQEERERQEREEQERKRQEQLAREAREKAEKERKRQEELAREEERKRQEIQRLEREKQERTQSFVSEMALLYPRMQACEKKGLKASVNEIDKILNEFNNLKNSNVDFYQSPVYSDACRIYNVLQETKNKIYEQQRNKKKRNSLIKKISLAAGCIAIISGGVYGFLQYKSTDAYKTKAADRTVAKQKKAEEKEQKRILKSYKVGGWGQAGVIFYDKGEYSDGWRFLEIAPTKSQNRYFGIYAAEVEGLKRELGTGDDNTKLLLEAFEEDSAAYYAANYSSGGKDDWYLGNVAEMQMCYKNLVNNSSNKKKIDKFVELGKIEKFYSRYTEYYKDGTICYLTSEQKDKSHCYTLCFSASSALLDGGKPMAPENNWKGFNHSKIEGYTNYVRPIRKF